MHSFGTWRSCRSIKATCFLRKESHSRLRQPGHRHAQSRKTRLSIISTKFTRDQSGYSVLQVASHDAGAGGSVNRRRHQGRCRPCSSLTGRSVPAGSTSAGHQKPMEHHQASKVRRAGFTLARVLATSFTSAGTTSSWFVGQVKETNSIAKMKPMLSECRVDIAARLQPRARRVSPDQERCHRPQTCLGRGSQAGSRDEIVTLARRTRPVESANGRFAVWLYKESSISASRESLRHEYGLFAGGDQRLAASTGSRSAGRY